MQNTLFYFLRSALIPKLRADISAGAACNIHFCLIGVAAVGAAPNQFAVGILLNLNFAVKAAFLAEIAFGVQFGIHYVVINELHNRKHGFNVILHIGYFNVRNRTAGRKRLEF